MVPRSAGVLRRGSFPASQAYSPRLASGRSASRSALQNVARAYPRLTISARGQSSLCVPRAASVATLLVHPRQLPRSQPRVSGMRGSELIAWLPQKLRARKTGTGPGRWLGRIIMRSMRGACGSWGATSSVIRRSVAWPPRKSRCSPVTVAFNCAGFGGMGPYM